MALPSRCKLLFLQPSELFHRHSTIGKFVCLLLSPLLTILALQTEDVAAGDMREPFELLCVLLRLLEQQARNPKSQDVLVPL